MTRFVSQLTLVAMLGAVLLVGTAGTASANAQRPLFVVDQAANSVIRVDLATGARTVVSSGGNLVDPTGVVVAPNGDIYVADRSASAGATGAVIRVTQTGAQSVVSASGLFVDPTGIAIGSDGDLYVSDSNAFQHSNGGVIRVNAVTGAQTPVSAEGLFKDPQGMAIAPDGSLVVVDLSQQDVFRVSPVTGAQTVVSHHNQLAKPAGVTVVANGEIYVADPEVFGNHTGAVLRVNPSTGAQTVAASGGAFKDPTGVVQLANGDLAVVDKSAFATGYGGVFRIAAGAQTVVASAGFQDPIGIALPPDSDGDEVPDYSDNCPRASNPVQSDIDSDRIGDSCDIAGLPAPPELGKSVVLEVVKGKVIIDPPGAGTSAKRVAKLTNARLVPVGTRVDAKHGTVRLTSARSDGTLQSGAFWSGKFKIEQKSKYKGLTTLLMQGKIGPCAKRKRARSSRSAQRKLWGDGKGRFQTRGNRSSATVRGTRWYVKDSCAGTLTKVARGVVVVKDFARKRSVTVRRGHHYLARPPKR